LVKRYVDVPKQADSNRQKRADVDDDGERLRRQQQQQLAAVQPSKPLPAQQ